MKFLLILPALFLVLLAPAQKQAAGDSSVNCMTNWIKGDFRTYTIVHDKRISRQGQTGTAFHLLYQAHVSVLDATDQNYTVKWVFHLPESTKAEHPGGADSIPIQDGMQIIFRISATGTFLELVNWEEVRDVYARLLNMSRDLFNTRERVESALIKEIQLYHLPYGYTFTTEKVTSETKLSNPQGGKPLPATQSYQVTEFLPQDDRYTLIIQQQTDKTPGQAATFEMSDYSEYQYIQSSGWIRHLLYKRSSVSEGISQSDSYTIDLNP